MAGADRYKQLAARAALCGAALCGAVLCAAGVALPIAPSFAQGFFDFFWGNRGSERNNDWNNRGFDRWNERGRGDWNERSRGSANERSDGGVKVRPNEQTNTPPQRSTSNSIRRRLRAPAAPREERDSAPIATTGASVPYCVRLCDGRYFAVQASGGDAAEICSAFCPAANTKIYSGTTIEHAVASDGKRYSALNTAFVYRQKVIDGCTCNGKDSFGLTRLEVNRDPTLRAGDIVARDGTLMAFKGSKKNIYTAGDFTPVQTYAKGDGRLRTRLSDVKVAPPLSANLSSSDNAANAAAPSPTGSRQGGRRTQVPASR